MEKRQRQVRALRVGGLERFTSSWCRHPQAATMRRMRNALWLDIRYCLRRLAQTPVLSLIITGTIVLVLVANIAIFSLLNVVVLRNVEVSSPDEIVSISAADAKTNQVGYFYADTVAAFRSAQRSFSQIAMYNGSGTLPVEMPDAPAIVVGFEDVGTGFSRRRSAWSRRPCARRFRRSASPLSRSRTAFQDCGASTAYP